MKPLTKPSKQRVSAGSNRFIWVLTAVALLLYVAALTWGRA